MEETISYVYNNSQGTVRDRLRWLFAFVKRMSDKPTTHKDSQDFLEELEWRVVYGEKLDSGDFRRMPNGTYRWVFNAKDVKLLVLPDEKAKVAALSDTLLQSFFRVHTPIMLTLENCLNF